MPGKILIPAFVFLFYGFSISAAYADTPVSGPMTTDTTWTLAGSPYIVEGDVTVNSAVTLTIEPGVQVKFDGYYQFRVDGVLNAQGRDGQLIIFTSNKLIRSPGDWRRILLPSCAKILSCI